MRVWLVDEKRGEEAGSLEALLRRLEGLPGTGLRLLGVSPHQADFPAAMRKFSKNCVGSVPCPSM